jgi:L-threonylcarbamoyladenylate synthase
MTLIKQPTPENILLAASNLKDGALIGLPTETVYGLAADAENESAIRRIYEVKGRPFDHPLIVHIGSIKYLEKWARDIPEYALKLAITFWPGPMTLILKRSKIAKDYVTGNQNSIAVRIPNHPVALSILSEFHKLGGNGLAAPSANKYSRVSSTTAKAVYEQLGKDLFPENDLIIDGGVCDIGLESTIINCLSEFPKTLRPGSVILENQVEYQNLKTESESAIKHSGDAFKHYSPNAQIVLDGDPRIGDGFIALAKTKTPIGCHRLSSPSNALEFAKNLYESLRLGDKLNLERIFVEVPEGNGIEIAIKDRLLKASHN